MGIRRHTNPHLLAGIAALERDGWSINADGTITRLKVETKKPKFRSVTSRLAGVGSS